MSRLLTDNSSALPPPSNSEPFQSDRLFFFLMRNLSVGTQTHLQFWCEAIRRGKLQHPNPKPVFHSDQSSENVLDERPTAHCQASKRDGREGRTNRRQQLNTAWLPPPERGHKGAGSTPNRATKFRGENFGPKMRNEISPTKLPPSEHLLPPHVWKSPEVGDRFEVHKLFGWGPLGEGTLSTQQWPGRGCWGRGAGCTHDTNSTRQWNMYQSVPLCSNTEMCVWDGSMGTIPSGWPRMAPKPGCSVPLLKQEHKSRG